MSGVTILVDFETRSRCDLKAHGGRRYAAHDSTELLCAVAAIDYGDGGPLHIVGWGGFAHPGPPDGWAVGEEHLAALGFEADDVRYYDWTGEDLHGVVRNALANGATVVAHNAHGFDAHIWRGLGYPEPARWVDSMDLARRASLPGGLGEIGRTLFDLGKDAKGHKLMLLLCKPLRAKKRKQRRPTKLQRDLLLKAEEAEDEGCDEAAQALRDAAGPIATVDVVDDNPPFLEPDAAQMRTVLRYNVRDVLLMAALCDEEGLLEPHVDDPVLKAHRAIDERGVCVDMELAHALLEAEKQLQSEAIARASEAFGTDAATAGRMLRSSVALPRWLREHGVQVDDVKAATLRGVLEGGASGDAAAVIRCRLDVATVTAGKVTALLNRVDADGRLRGGTAYYGAHTGRWSGKAFQPQNLPRPPAGWGDEHVRAVRGHGYDGAAKAAEWLGCSVAAVLGACLRGLVCAPAGYRLAQVDLDQIEARVLLWLAGDEAGLDVFRRGDDPYVAQAAAMDVAAERAHRKALQHLQEGGVLEAPTKTSRQVGKVAVLALGFGGSVGAFDAMASGYGLDVESLDVAHVVESYRDSVPSLAGRRTGGSRYDPETGHRYVFRRGGFWKRCNAAAVSVARSIGSPHPVTADDPDRVGRVAFYAEGPDMIMQLPNRRCLRYRNAAVEHDPTKWGGKGAEVLRFDGVKHGRKVRADTYGGRLAENATQAVARDVLAHGLTLLEADGLRTVLTIHDEVLVEVPASVVEAEALAQIEGILTNSPAWADGLPLGAKGTLGDRYAK